MVTLEKFEKTPYEALGVSRNASKDEIRSAYRRLARRHHPDSGLTTSRSPARFKEISDAYEVLSDDDKRARLDASLQGGSRPERNLEGQLRETLEGPDNSLRRFLLNLRVALDRDVRRGVEDAAANLRKGLVGLKDNRRDRTDSD